jgi:peroxiredoxin
MPTQIRSVKEPKGLPVGAQVPNFEAKDLFNQTFQLTAALKKGSLVVIFYRGQWCPLCNKHLKAVENQLEEIYAKGAQVVAVSPERSEFFSYFLMKIMSFPDFLTSILNPHSPLV